MRARTRQSTPTARTHPLRRERLAAKMTLSEVGERLGVQKAAVSLWELGRRLPEPANAIAIVRLFPRLTIEQLYRKAS